MKSDQITYIAIFAMLCLLAYSVRKGREDVAKQTKPNLSAVASAVTQVKTELGTLTDSLAAKRRVFVAAGEINASTIKSLSDLDALDLRIHDYRRSSADLMKYYLSVDDHILAALGDAKLTQAQQSEVQLGYRKGAGIKGAIAVLELDQAVTTDLLNLTALLRQEWGKWSVSNRMVVFETDRAFDDYAGIVSRVTAARAKVAELKALFTP